MALLTRFCRHAPCNDTSGEIAMLNRAIRSSRIDLAGHRAAIDADWERVSERKPCPICGGDSGCRRNLADAFVCCSRRPSEWPLTDGGWLHRVKS